MIRYRIKSKSAKTVRGDCDRIEIDLGKEGRLIAYQRHGDGQVAMAIVTLTRHTEVKITKGEA